MMRREQARKGWVIYSNGRPWDDWVYPTEAAALATVEQCKVASATVVPGKLQGVIGRDGCQYSQKLLKDRWRR